MTTAHATDWTSANQALLTAEIACLMRRIVPDAEGPEGERLGTALEAAQSKMPSPGALDLLAELFGLTPFERELLLLCCGVELDAQLAGACASNRRIPGQGDVTFGLGLALLSDPHWSALTPWRPLRRWRLIEVEPGQRLVDCPIRVDERILHFVAGINAMDARLRPLLTEHARPNLVPASHEALIESIANRLSDGRYAGELVHLDGNDPQGREDVFASVASRTGCHAYSLRADDLPAAPLELELLQALLERESRLLPALFLLQGSADVQASSRRRFCENLGAPLFTSGFDTTGLQRPSRAWTVDKPEPNEQKRLWQQALGAGASHLNGTLDALSGQFRMSARRIGGVAASLPTDTDDAEAVSDGSEIWAACRRFGHEQLDDLAQRIEPTATWEDLVLPTGQQNTLRQIAAHLRQKTRVFEQWGFGRQGQRGLGVSALFCGESGTGKTLAAEVLANELKLDLYRIDLSAVVSKYIGETEKNLRRVFDAAEDSGAILLFDEADALFGKRSEVKDSHDRYANIEVSYLLQRMEAYRGLAVLTSNMKASLDRAFQRRLRFIVNFPFPDSALRESIWRRAFPRQAPVEGLDYAKLARLNLPGGNIRNIALNAAFLAAELGEPLRMSHLLRAAQSEGGKLERPLADAEIRGWT
ncbi:ATP-binding protein [Arenimonas terrae]|uniref:ATP-binding protein n=1 Tax=Arenimonas terrae TaxID=2546226 RepID=A0A5C4RXH3_9GAMM|nr:ATP-binding protein [Arenimonas terrae]TNJ35431.1 ATP-binding protein [Arenimonas terrae]